MEVEVVGPAPPVDFNFDSACSSPYMTAPSSPQRFGNFFFSAPNSPTRAIAFYSELNNLTLAGRPGDEFPRISVPFKWEERPGIPKSKETTNNGDWDSIADDEDFEFDFSGQLERTSLSADELFDGGKIRPLKPPPCLQINEQATNTSSPRLPRSKLSQGNKMVQEALSPRHQKQFDPIAEGLKQTNREQVEFNNQSLEEPEKKRGRETKTIHSSSSSSSSSVRKGSRSLPPLRVSDIIQDREEYSPSTGTVSSNSSTSIPKSSILSSLSFSIGYRKWRLRDLLLFRSASEGRSTDKDPLRKYAVLPTKGMEDDIKGSSFRSTESNSGSVSSSRRRGGAVSPHELHYTVNRAASEEMRRKTFLPYKQGLLGCLGFNPGLYEISRGIGSLTRGSS